MDLFIFFPITGFTEDTEIKKNVDFIPYPPNKEDILVTYHECDVLSKGQLNSEWIYEVIVSPKMPTKNFKDFCPTL